MEDATRAFAPEEFTHHMKALKGVSQATYDCLESRARYVWSRCQFCPTSRNHYITNNLFQFMGFRSKVRTCCRSFRQDQSSNHEENEFKKEVIDKVEGKCIHMLTDTAKTLVRS